MQYYVTSPVIQINKTQDTGLSLAPFFALMDFQGIGTLRQVTFQSHLTAAGNASNEVSDFRKTTVHCSHSLCPIQQCLLWSQGRSSWVLSLFIESTSLSWTDLTDMGSLASYLLLGIPVPPFECWNYTEATTCTSHWCGSWESDLQSLL